MPLGRLWEAAGQDTALHADELYSLRAPGVQRHSGAAFEADAANSMAGLSSRARQQATQFFSIAESKRAVSREDAARFIFAPATSFNFTVEEAAHDAHHASDDAKAISKELANDTSFTAEEAKFLAFITGPLTFLTSIFAITAAYLEVQNGLMLTKKAQMLKEDLANPTDE
eukprot:TRINITY_DN71830_c0_g1_i1.p1 TRINITY_DN71830_c0_g1~~TRINITY_DN71830_c0_g1_i1.p1  ORF type:complete len:185 (-),score=51.18 TRINITY_DN71830_c0_g1_i1:76-588(-)